MTNEATTITINLFYVWIAAKVISAFALTRWENKYLTSSASNENQLSLATRRFIFHLLLNPELGLAKMIVFLPVWVITGTRYLSAFLPIKTEWSGSPSMLEILSQNYDCKMCKDTHVINIGGKKINCSCASAKWWADAVRKNEKSKESR